MPVFQPHLLLLPISTLLLLHLPLFFGYSFLTVICFLPSDFHLLRKSSRRDSAQVPADFLRETLVPGEKRVVHLLWFNIIFCKILECHLYYYCKSLCIFFLTLIGELFKSRCYVLFSLCPRIWERVLYRAQTCLWKK